jgi:hypothetical protein
MGFSADESGRTPSLFSTVRVKAYDTAFRRRRLKLNMDDVDVRVASADAIANWGERFDIVYSFDVFEHLPVNVLEKVVPAMLDRLTPSGFCLIRLNPFPSIAGGHRVERYNLRDTSPCPTPPWQHLRDLAHGLGDTFLNRLSQHPKGGHIEIQAGIFQPPKVAGWFTAPFRGATGRAFLYSGHRTGISTILQRGALCCRLDLYRKTPGRPATTRLICSWRPRSHRWY